MNFRRASQRFLLALLLFGLTFALFSPTLRYKLVDIDDQSYISSNPLVMEGISKSHVCSVFSSFQQGTYAPLLWISYGLDAALLGASPTNPWGFHFINALLHALNSVLLFLIFWAFRQKPWQAFFCAAIWAFHPLRVESVAWVTERKDVLSGFFGLLCLGTYVWAFSRRKSPAAPPRPALPLLTASVIFLALGLLVKPSLVPVPGALLLLDFWPLRRFEPTFRSMLPAAPRLLTEKIPFFVLAALASFGASAAHTEMHALMDVPRSTRLLTIPIHYAFYLAKSVFPHNLSPLYPDAPRSVLLFGLSSLLLLALMIGAWVFRHRRPNLLVGWLFFLGFLIPAIGLVRFGVQSIADRFTYLPAIGLSIALLGPWPSAGKHAGRRHLLQTFITACILALLAFGTLRLIPAWKSSSTLIRHVLSITPENPIGLSMHSFQLIYTAGNFKAANAGFDRIIQSGFYNQDVLGGKARCLAALQGPAAAKSFLLQAPGTDNPYAVQFLTWDLARYSLMLQEYDDAIRYALQALQLPSENQTSPAYFHLLIMTAAYEKGDLPLALAHARQFPSYADKTSLTLADLLPYYLFQWIECHRTDAYGFFRRLIAADSHPHGYLNNIAWGLATADWSPAPPAEVLALARQVCGTFTQANPGALDTLAAAQANAGDYPAAIESLQQALELLPASQERHVVQFKQRLLSRLALYQQQQPYREEAFSRLMAAQFGKGLFITDKNTAP